jgi:GH24 family phage-related lysozyme (muramidase)
MFPVTPTAQNIADGLRWEGERLQVYTDSLGYYTQGIGRHVGVTRGDPDITREISRNWFAQDWDRARQQAREMFEGFDLLLEDVRADALTWLVFNMGAAMLAEFVPFIRYVNARKWREAAFHLLTNTSGHLTPYTLQTGARAVETALRIATGEVLEEFRTP